MTLWMSTRSLPGRPSRWPRTLMAAGVLALGAAAALPALAADPGSTNRVVLDGCPAVQTGPGVTALGTCEANGNPRNRTAAEAGNANGDMHANTEARVEFYALEREVSTASLWLDTLVFLGGVVPDRLALQFGMDGTLFTNIVRGTISPPGTEQGWAAMNMAGAARPGANWSGQAGAVTMEANLSPTGAGSFSQIFERQAELVLDIDGLVAGALLDVTWSLYASAWAGNLWFRDGGGSVVSGADGSGGLRGVRWLDANGRDLGDAVSWRWTHRAGDAVDPPGDPSPLPLPGSAGLLMLGIVLLATARRRQAAGARRAAGAALAALGAVVAAPALAQTSVVPNVTYCAPQGRAQQLDLYLPDFTRHTGARPLAVYVHGGGWTGGSRTDPRARPEIDELQARGYVVAAVSYRLAPAFPFPAALDDVRCAVRFLRAHASRWSIDPQRVVAWGTSAGGHIAGLLAYTRPEDAVGTAPTEWTGVSHQVRAAALFYAPLDLQTLFAGAPASAWTPIFGNEPNALARYSPSTYVRAGSVPTLLVHGNRDTTVPAAQSVALMQRLQQVDVPAQLQLVARASHSLDLSGGSAIYPGRGDIARLVGRFFDVETLAPSDAVRAASLSDVACVAEWLPTRRSTDFNGAHAGLQTRPGATGPTTVRSWLGSQTWWATDGTLTWVGGGRFGPGVPDGPFASQVAEARAADCGLDARR